MDRRLISFAYGYRRWLVLNVAAQWFSMLANVAAICSVGWLCDRLLTAGVVEGRELGLAACVFAAALVARFAFACLGSLAVQRVCAGVKSAMRNAVYAKLLELGPSYTQRFSTSEVVQVASEGVDQLEMYFGRYLPQLFYAVLAPFTLFAIVETISMPAAVILLVCVPLIPVCIVAVQKIAGRLFKRYWGTYTELGDIFLEDVQGMTTLKINQADGFYQRKMNEAAERFRLITMSVLRMQLNSIIVMDLVAYGGAAVGIVVAAWQLASGAIGFAGALVIVLLAAEFFIPMRTLGSYFHVAMNGMSASKKIFAILDAPVPEPGTAHLPAGSLDVAFEEVGFSYAGSARPDSAADAGMGGSGMGAGHGARRNPLGPGSMASLKSAAEQAGVAGAKKGAAECAGDAASEQGKRVLDGFTLTARAGSLTGIVGLSGCGKSTAVNLLVHRMRGYEGSIRVGGVELSQIPTAELLSRVTLVGNASYLFAGTVADNLRMARPGATDAEMRDVLTKVRIWDFFEAAEGLATPIAERAANLSGGQRQRLALARALLHGGDVFVFDEATSNIDPESEAVIMEAVESLARDHAVLLISHRLACVRNADVIALVEGGRVAELGSHAELVARGGSYARMFEEQRALEEYGRGGESAGDAGETANEEVR